ncbi:unnamed protein product, partial [Rotaria sp. Silwood1]
CGQDAIQIRTRIPIRRTRNGSKRCGPLKETKYCQTAAPCSTNLNKNKNNLVGAIIKIDRTN